MTAFQIAGGIFVFMIGLEMLRGAHVRTRTLPEEQAEARTKEDISLIPLAIPLLAGPGAITMVIVLMGKAVGFWASAMVVFLISIVSLLSYGILRRSSMLIRLAGPSGVRVMNRVMGLILSAIAVQILINGLKGLAPEVLLSLNLASMGGH